MDGVTRGILSHEKRTYKQHIYSSVICVSYAGSGLQYRNEVWMKDGWQGGRKGGRGRGVETRRSKREWVCLKRGNVCSSSLSIS